LEREALAAVVAHPLLAQWLAELSPDHFDDERYRCVREHLAGGGAAEGELVPVLPALDAVAAARGLDERTGKQLLLRLKERRRRREIAAAELEGIPDLQDRLARVRAAAMDLA